MQIIRFDEDIVKRLPNIEKVIYDMFGSEDVLIFAVLDEKQKMGFVVRSNDGCLYIDNKGESIPFSLDENDDLSLLRKDDYVINFNEELTFMSQDNIMHFLRLHKYNQPDCDGYDGSIEYKQYDSKRDIMCVINYQQMYREYDGRPCIYQFRTNEIDGVYIDEKYSRGDHKKGFPLPKRAKYYTKVECAEDEIGYDWMKIKDYGLVNFLSNNIPALERGKSIRYVKSLYRGLDGSFRDLWPLAKQIRREAIDEIVKSYGFNTQVPSLFISVYNGYDETVKDIQAIVEEMKRVLPLLKTEEGSDLGAVLKFVKE